MSKEQRAEWTEEVGRSISTMSAMYGFISRVWSSMKIGIEIISWLKTEDGKKEAETVLRLLGEKYLQTQKTEKTQFLKRIFENEIIKLDETDGSETLADASDVFTGFIDADFKKWKLNNKGSATLKTPVKIYELADSGTFAQVFGSMFGASVDTDTASVEKFIQYYRENLRNVCFEQSQIKGFARKYRDKLRTDGYGTFFLFEDKKTERFFVAYVDFNSNDALYVRVYKLEYDSRCLAGSRLSFVLPQLAEAQTL